MDSTIKSEYFGGGDTTAAGLADATITGLGDAMASELSRSLARGESQMNGTMDVEVGPLANQLQDIAVGQAP